MLEILPIPAFQDNYIWAICPAGDSCAVVDPGQAGPVLEFLDARQLHLSHILLTHHHFDHAGGVNELLKEFPAQVFGPFDKRMPPATEHVGDGDAVQLLGLEFLVMEVPAHTNSHIAFYGHDLLFSGDTLFSAGCGKLFEGTPDDMQRALDRFAGLPDTTRVYCGHEYTQSNCRFALAVEPDNKTLIERAAQVDLLRKDGKVTLPSTIGLENSINPFMRSRQPALIKAARLRDQGAGTPDQVLSVIRQWKDSGDW